MITGKSVRDSTDRRQADGPQAMFDLHLMKPADLPTMRQVLADVAAGIEY
jgi:hypothetical protein